MVAGASIKKNPPVLKDNAEYSYGVNPGNFEGPFFLGACQGFVLGGAHFWRRHETGGLEVRQMRRSRVCPEQFAGTSGTSGTSLTRDNSDGISEGQKVFLNFRTYQ